jgi:hypothetical protein
MKVMAESTTKIVQLNGVPARIWEGTTESGVPCHLYVTRIAVANEEDSSQFEAELQQCRAPSPAVAAIDSRLIL